MDSNNQSQNIQTTTNILKFTYGLVPVIAGLDKFTYFLTNWEMYLNPVFLKLIPVTGHTFMIFVGIIEIIAGIIVLMRPKLGSLIVMAWLICIAFNLISYGFYDIAVRDLTMAVGAYTLFRLIKYFPERKTIKIK